jgi:type I restriction-modification system DNA methylase subunit
MAKDESLPEEKRKVMIDTSNAYRDSYTLARQINLLKEDGILDKLDKLLNKRKKFERMCCLSKIIEQLSWLHSIVTVRVSLKM